MSIRRPAVTALVVAGGLAALAGGALGQTPESPADTSPTVRSSQNAGDKQYLDPFASIAPPKRSKRAQRRNRPKRRAQSRREARSQRTSDSPADASPQPVQDRTPVERETSRSAAAARAAAAERAARRRARRAARRFRQRARRAASRADSAGKTTAPSNAAADADSASAGPPAAIRPRDGDGGSLDTALLAGVGVASLALLALLGRRLHRVRRRS